MLKYLPLVKPFLLIAAKGASILLGLLTILSAYGGRIDPEWSGIPSSLTLALPYFIWATLIVSALWLIFGKIFMGIGGAVILLICWGPATVASPLGSTKLPDDPAQTFRIMTYNMIHGIDMQNLNTDSNRTVQYILDSDCDIVCLQELRKVDATEIPSLTDAQSAALKKKYPYQLGDPALDTKLLSKYPATFVKGATYIDGPYDTERYTFYKVNIKGHLLTVVNLHLRSFMLTAKERDVITGINSVEDLKTSYREVKGDISKKLKQGFTKRKKDAEILRKALDGIRGPLIVLGDFNDVPESYAYRLIKGDDLKDAYVETNFGPLITYNEHAMWFHIDQILYRGALKALKVDKGKLKASDHYPLIAEFEFTAE
ncbi:MAG: endonuclease/exonuclease/phosphatase family protein [Muribaculaceae bacterium]|nr:endonuclease/exonuclease/phosphatase family protein [Muribaculaceae bacterium]